MRRPSASTLSVLAVFLEEPATPRYGLELGKLASVGSGTLYPILERLEDDGHIAGDWEDISEAVEGRRRRRYYTLTPNGRIWAEQELRRFQRFDLLGLRPAVLR